MKFPNKERLTKRMVNEFVNDDLVRDLQLYVVGNVIKPFIAKGISPVRGFGRFGEYLWPDKYPGKGDKRKKPNKPVNLNLTGAMLKEFKAFKSGPKKVGIGYSENAGDFTKIKAEAHNYGTTRRGVGAIPRRRFIPAKGEIWAVSVMREVKKIFTKRFVTLFNKK